MEKLSHRPAEPGKSKGTSHKRKRINPPLSKPRKGCSGKPPGAADRAAKTVSYRTTPSGLQIMPLKKGPSGVENGDASSEKDEKHFGNGSHQPDVDLTDSIGEQDASGGECDGPHSALVENGLGLLVFLSLGFGSGVVVCGAFPYVQGHSQARPEPILTSATQQFSPAPYIVSCAMSVTDTFACAAELGPVWVASS